MVAESGAVVFGGIGGLQPRTALHTAHDATTRWHPLSILGYTLIAQKKGDVLSDKFA